MIQLNCPKNYARTITGRKENNSESPIYIGVIEGEGLLKTYSVQFKQESLEKYKNIVDIPEDKVL